GGGGAGGSAYGSASAPVDLGSGGGTSGAASHDGGDGGGRIRLDVDGSLTVSGWVLADGEDAPGSEDGGGSGGSIWISTGTLAGAGMVSAMGGDGYDDVVFDGGGGGGGRIAVYYDSSTFTGSVFVTGGVGPGTAVDGAAGTFADGSLWKFREYDSFGASPDIVFRHPEDGGPPADPGCVDMFSNSASRGTGYFFKVFPKADLNNGVVLFSWIAVSEATNVTIDLAVVDGAYTQSSIAGAEGTWTVLKTLRTQIASGSDGTVFREAGGYKVNVGNIGTSGDATIVCWITDDHSAYRGYVRINYLDAGGVVEDFNGTVNMTTSGTNNDEGEIGGASVSTADMSHWSFREYDSYGWEADPSCNLSKPDGSTARVRTSTVGQGKAYWYRVFRTEDVDGATISWWWETYDMGTDVAISDFMIIDGIFTSERIVDIEDVGSVLQVLHAGPGDGTHDDSHEVVGNVSAATGDYVTFLVVIEDDSTSNEGRVDFKNMWVGWPYYEDFDGTEQIFVSGTQHDEGNIKHNMDLVDVCVTQITDNIGMENGEGPMIRIHMTANGVDNPTVVDQIMITANNDNLADILDPNGVKLYYTTGQDVIMGAPLQTQNRGATVTFTGLSQALQEGDNYFWVTFTTHTGATAGNKLNCHVAISSDISVTGDAYTGFTFDGGTSYLYRYIAYFFDRFDRRGTTLDSGAWMTPDGTVLVDGAAELEPTSPYSATLQGTGATLTTYSMDISAAGSARLYYKYELGHLADDPPDATDYLYVEYFHQTNGWTLLQQHSGGLGGSQNWFTNMVLSVPAGGLHSNFQVRFRLETDSPMESFHIEDVLVTKVNDGPTAPTNLLAEGADPAVDVGDASPDFTARHNDPEADPANQWRIQISPNDDATSGYVTSSGGVILIVDDASENDQLTIQVDTLPATTYDIATAGDLTSGAAIAAAIESTVPGVTCVYSGGNYTITSEATGTAAYVVVGGGTDSAGDLLNLRSSDGATEVFGADFSTVTWDSWDRTLGALLNSGSSIAPAVPYDGSGLTWGETYYWRIRFRDINGNEGAWSQTAQLSMALPETTASADGNGSALADGYRLLGFPIPVGTIVSAAELNDDVTPGVGVFWVFKWDEAAHDWVQVFVGDDLEGGRGYFVWSTPGATIDVGNGGTSTGVGAVGDQKIPLTWTSLGAASDEESYVNQFRGFNLVSNPFNSPIDWDNVDAARRVNCDPTYYVWDGTEYRWYQTGGDPVLSTFDSFDDGSFKNTSPRTWTESVADTWLLDGQFGCAVGDSGKILTTEDRGETWTSQTYNASYTLYGVQFPVDARTGYIVGGDGAAGGGLVLKTTDGGATWTDVTPTNVVPDDLYGLWFLDNDTGFVTGKSGKIYRTDDGAADPATSWTSQNSTVTEDVMDIHFPVDDQSGFAVTWGDSVLKTTNGGTTWQELVLSHLDYHEAVWFWDNDKGYVGGGNDGNFARLDRTLNGSNSTPTWTQKSPSSGHVKDIHFPVTADTGFASAKANTVSRTKNGTGSCSWTSVGPLLYNINTAFNGVHAVSDETVYVVGHDPNAAGKALISKTINAQEDPGNPNWTEKYSLSGTDQLRAVHFPEHLLVDRDGLDDRISTPSSMEEGTWEWRTAFSDVSAGADNTYYFYFILDASDKGYGLRIRSGATNELALLRLDPGEAVLASATWDPGENAVDGFHIFRVTRDASNFMEVWLDGVSVMSATDGTYQTVTKLDIRFKSTDAADRSMTDVIRTGTQLSHPTDSGTWGAISKDIIPAFRAFWVHASLDVFPSIEIPDPQTSAPAVPMSTPAFDANWWRMQVKVEAGVAQDAGNYCGVHHAASVVYDTYDVMDAGSAADPYVMGLFPHFEWEEMRKGFYAQDMKTTPFVQGGTASWRFRVRTNSAALVTLSFPNLADLPANWTYEIEDRGTGQVTALVPGATVSYAAGAGVDRREFTIRATRLDTAVGGLAVSDAGPIPAGAVVPGTTGVTMLSTRLACSIEGIHVDRIRFRGAGTGDEAADVDAVWLLRDLNGNGSYEAGTDVLLGPLTYAADDGTVEFAVDADLANGQSEVWDLLYDFGAAPGGATFSASLDPASDIGALGDFTKLSPTISGSAVSGGVKSVSGGSGGSSSGGLCGAGAGPGNSLPLLALLVLLFVVRLRRRPAVCSTL
ncbi:MAG: YCF48-related protein, partial [Planctomycetota bacterium]